MQTDSTKYFAEKRQCNRVHKEPEPMLPPQGRLLSHRFYKIHKNTNTVSALIFGTEKLSTEITTLGPYKRQDF